MITMSEAFPMLQSSRSESFRELSRASRRQFQTYKMASVCGNSISCPKFDTAYRCFCLVPCSQASKSRPCHEVRRPSAAGRVCSTRSANDRYSATVCTGTSQSQCYRPPSISTTTCRGLQSFSIAVVQASRPLSAQVLMSLTDAVPMSTATMDRWRRTALTLHQIATRAPTSACSIAYPAQVSSRTDMLSTRPAVTDLSRCMKAALEQLSKHHLSNHLICTES